MYHNWIPNSDPEIKASMLRAIDKNIDDLFADIPEPIRLKRSLNVGFGRPLSEYEVLRLVDKILSKNRVFRDPPPFIGGGLCASYTPSIVRLLSLRGEIYTAYTPYQPEINQGILQALFEYQSMMAELYGVDVINASMYDGSTAVAEAFRLAMRVTGRRKILVPETMNPFHRSVANTWVSPVGGVIAVYRVDGRGQPLIRDLIDKVDGETAAVYLENPSFLGNLVEEPEEVGGVARSKGSLFIVFSDPTSLGIIKPPGSYGADIIVGDGQSLGLGLNYGGPGLGILGVRMDQGLLKQLPGRLVGATLDSNGDRGYALILQTREQHIRREKATSNITTNSSLMAIMGAIYISYLGWNGLRRLGESILKRTRYAVESIRKRLPGRVSIAIDTDLFFKEVPLRFHRRNYREIHRDLLARGIHGGLWLKDILRGYEDCSLFCFSEVHSKSDIDLLINALDEVS
ncbi:MAG TPA: aminomethyl-transferring glycine dehydrogenase subunit GcvPA [Sulfolobales archaeon]|nr:aminomethyl-transferring glycine dehydrogenase subunit GcvPA [Sulfolobales archaeon]